MTDKHTAISLLKKFNISLSDAARLVLELLEESGGAEGTSGNMMGHCRRVIRLGVQALRQEEETVPFAEAVAATLKAKEQQLRAKRTLADIGYYTRRLMRECPGLAKRPLRAMSSAECSALLERVFPTLTQRRKARAILSGVFRTAQRRGWCGENPMSRVEVPVVREAEILPLELPEVKRLLTTAAQAEHAACLPALGLMLYAGVRPEEVTRLRWQDIDAAEQEVIIRPRHSKTGGGRHIAICPALRALLRSKGERQATERICPRNWQKRWLQLRRQAGFKHWVPDVLRHTFASYYVKQYRDMNSLQLYMGHRNQQLLLTRYVNLRNVSQKAAAAFWGTRSKTSTAGWPARASCRG